ncbi:diguanylate cyclase (GGDEF)-like protein [Deinococcus sp. HSC-46F16]|uniref:GGDEF domain-containing protein n=1 Tax=Deinococcus sp. HSC-46F16 TaxID=2910968 RepID=UPI0020A17CDB|nr:GGDEF domain-containing protein [Deinococcus sp. HSC-46F16]MCP2015037.1 diguanylate cyclase (GGDEF)-like protein [Deinococcus sp. HSC-46F16]
MPPRPVGPADLPERIARVYFRFLVPLVGAAVLWIISALTGSVHPLVALFSGTLALFALLHLLRPGWGEAVRLGFAVSVLVFVAVLALEPQQLHVRAAYHELIVHLLLLLIPLNVLIWHLLFSDRPRRAQVLALALTGTGALAATRWENVASTHLTTSALLLAVSLFTHFFAGAVVDLQRRMREEERRARQDPLTGLGNRLAFAELCAQSLTPGVLAVLDIDHFKAVNDRWGHEAGDRVLREVAAVLREVLGVGVPLFRWGGEEFVVCLPGRSVHGAARLLEGVRAGIAGHTFGEGQQVTLSVGLCAYTPEQGLAHAFSQADAALRQAKDGGRDRLVAAPAA